MPDVNDTPLVVYHYTSMDSLLKMLDSKEVWATNVRYLNDVSEHSLFVRAASNRVSEFAKTHDGVDVGVFYQHDIDSSKFPVPFYELPFVTSFATKKDSLTHWRSYCPKESGVCMGFKTSALQKARVRSPEKAEAGMIVPSPVFSRVQYVDPNNTGVLDAELQRAYDVALVEQKDWERIPGFSFSLGDTFFGQVTGSAAFYKDGLFEDEREYRLAIDSIRWRRDLICFRTSPSALIPYVPLVVPRVQEPDDPTGRLWNALASITIGPSPNIDLSLDSLMTVCEQKGIVTQVEKSHVPYRDW